MNVILEEQESEMKKLILTTGELSKLDLITIEVPKVLRIRKIEKEIAGGGLIVETTDKVLSTSGTIYVDDLNAKDAVASSLGYEGYEPIKSEIDYFIKVINTTALRYR